jgi:hypothetical protein
MRWFRRAFALLVVVGVLGAVGSPSQAAVRLPLHPMPIVGRARLPHTAPTDPITFHGGAVMAGDVRIYVVWYGDWSATQRRRRIVTDFLGALASPYWNINRGYPNRAGRLVTASPALAGEIDDPGSVGTTMLTDEQIQAVVQRAITTKTLPRDSHGIYLVLTSAKITKRGFLTEYCGWHSYARIAGSIVKFAFIGDPSGPKIDGCSPRGAGPNRDAGADSMASTIAHELEETVTDPTFNGWRTDRGEENGDRCAWQFGTTYGTINGRANVRLGSRDYLLQTNRVNDAHPHCGLAP